MAAGGCCPAGCCQILQCLCGIHQNVIQSLDLVAVFIRLESFSRGERVRACNVSVTLVFWIYKRFLSYKSLHILQSKSS